MLPRAAVQSLSLFSSKNVNNAVNESSVTLDDAEIRSLAARFGSPMLVVDCEQVRRQYHSLKAALPGVDLHYALKPLPHVASLAVMGLNLLAQFVLHRPATVSARHRP